MELPTDIWDIIVKQSKKSNADIVDDMNLPELKTLETIIAEKKTELYNSIKSKLDKYDIIEVFDENDDYIMDCVVIDKSTKKECCIKVCGLRSGNTKTVLGNYYSGNMFNENLCLTKCNIIRIKSKLEQRNIENIKIANDVKVGDVICYSLYTCAEWCKLKNRIYEMETLETGLRYGVIDKVTFSKIVLCEYYKTDNTAYMESCLKYINKNVVISKLNYEDNEEEFIKCKKRFGYNYFLDINRITDITEYFKTVDKWELIEKQKHLGVRPYL